MFSALVGVFDWPATFMVIGVAVAIAATFVAYWNRTPVKLQEMKLQNERDLGLANVERQRAAELAKIDQKVITSHRSED